eukprot:TRINITY_DN30219_c0_g1_i1.p1 TRINITY_DN30219_c0_g1~~TRINITY_DN30219_c0_g1_i1.p1  ORF type:complete len:577 (-),score=59.81 TRINITY_DN30219_c0_g1_i1:119-1849(-)
MMAGRRVCVGMCVAFVLMLPLASGDVSIIVRTDSGAISGVVNSTSSSSGQQNTTNVASFMGIPYAHPPVGLRRFRPPEPHPPWEGVRAAKDPGPVCAQLPLISSEHVPYILWPSMDEDCLYLNMWAPVDERGSIAGKKPLLVFFHGGAFMTGSGYQMMGAPFYNARGLSKEINAVIATVNYRLGVFGFFADPALKAESGTTGNYGIQDQRAAMAWVQRNAASFGGDAARITIVGNSAGATSVLHHAILPRSSGLFAQVISQSGYDNTWPLHAAYSSSDKIKVHIACHNPDSFLSCLRNASAKSLLEAQDNVFFAGSDFTSRAMFFGPVSDGYELPESTSFIQATKSANPHVPLLLGSNLNETNLFLCMDSGLSSDIGWQDAANFLLHHVQVIVPGTKLTVASMEQLLQKYRNFATPREAVMAATSDFLFTCAARRTAKAFAASGAPVYRYLFSRTPALYEMDKCFGVPHTAELNLLFKDAFPSKAQSVVVGDPVEQRLADFMIQAWGRFVWGQAPASEWARWSVEQQVLQIGEPGAGNISQLLGYRSDECSVMDMMMDTQGQGEDASETADDSLMI